MATFLLAATSLAQTPVVRRVFVGDPERRPSPGCRALVQGENLGPQEKTDHPPSVRVLVNGRPAYVFYGSARELMIQIPAELQPGLASMVVEDEGRRSEPFRFQVAPYSPYLLPAQITNNTGATKLTSPFRHLNGSIVTALNAAMPGETIEIFNVTGLGSTNPLVATGTAGPESPPARTLNLPRVTVASRQAAVLTAAASSAEGDAGIGAYWVRFVVPGDLGSGRFPVRVAAGQERSNAALLWVGLQGIHLNQRGFVFTAVEGGAIPPTKSFQVLNGTGEVLNYNVVFIPQSGGSAWLKATPAAGTVGANTISDEIEVGPATTSLPPGNYYAEVRIEAPGAANSPQSLMVLYRVLRSEDVPTPVVRPEGIVFNVRPDGANPGPEAVRLTNLRRVPVPYRASIQFEGARNPFMLAGAAGTTGAGQSSIIRVGVNTAGLAAGVYRAKLVIEFPGGLPSRNVDLLLIARAEQEKASTNVRAAGQCVPQKLLPVTTQLGAGFSSPVAWPAPMEVKVFDDCGGALEEGTVEAVFSNGDPPLSLVSLKGGRWSATWVPRNPQGSNAKVTLVASDEERGLQGSVELSGAVPENPEVPVVFTGGVVSAASFSATAVPSPGELVAVFGTALAPGVEAAASLPLPTQMQGTTLQLGGRRLPLVAVSPGQVNAILPYELASGASHQLLVRRGAKISVPESVTVARAQPAIFTTNLTGKGQGHIYHFPEAGRQVLAGPGSPARAGSVLVIYCTGLGGVTPSQEAGAPAPGEPLRRISGDITLRIGGKQATVIFAGLTPGLAGLYQVNAVVPEGVEAGDQVPVVLVVGDYESPEVSMAVQ